MYFPKQESGSESLGKYSWQIHTGVIVPTYHHRHIPSSVSAFQKNVIKVQIIVIHVSVEPERDQRVYGEEF